MKKEVVVIEAKEKVNRRNSKKIKRTRVAAYCRVSTDDDEQRKSFNSQVEHYKQIIEENPDWVLVKIYTDEGISGTQVTNREGFQQMINDAVDGKIDLIITKSISRFARNVVDILRYVRLLREKNVAIEFEKEKINTLDIHSEFLLTLLSSLAQMESENISSNVKAGLKMKMNRGEMVGFHGALGYDYDKETKTISINKEEAEVVRYIFRRYVEGVGCYVIAQELTQLGYKTKRGNTKWHESTIRGIIKNEKYKGDLLQGKTITVDPISHRRLENMGEEQKFHVPGNHEAIIPPETFDNAQEILKKRSSRYNNKGRGEKYSRKYAFSSMIECGFCGSHFSRRTWHAKSQYEKKAWSCVKATKHGKKNCPNSKSISEADLEAAYVDAFNFLCTKQVEVVEEIMEDIRKSLNSTVTMKKLKQVKAEAEKIRVKMSQFVDLHSEGLMDKEVYKEKYLQLTSELDKIREKQQQLENTATNEEKLSRRLEIFQKRFERREKLNEFDRDAFEATVEKVIIGEKDDDGNINPYSVTFVFKTGMKTEHDLSKKAGAGGALCPHPAHDTRGVRSIDVKGGEVSVLKRFDIRAFRGFVN